MIADENQRAIKEVYRQASPGGQRKFEIDDVLRTKPVSRQYTAKQSLRYETKLSKNRDVRTRTGVPQLQYVEKMASPSPRKKFDPNLPNSDEVNIAPAYEDEDY